MKRGDGTPLGARGSLRATPWHGPKPQKYCHILGPIVRVRKVRNPWCLRGFSWYFEKTKEKKDGVSNWLASWKRNDFDAIAQRILYKVETAHTALRSSCLLKLLAVAFTHASLHCGWHEHCVDPLPEATLRLPNFRFCGPCLYSKNLLRIFFKPQKIIHFWGVVLK